MQSKHVLKRTIRQVHLPNFMYRHGNRFKGKTENWKKKKNLCDLRLSRGQFYGNSWLFRPHHHQLEPPQWRPSEGPHTSGLQDFEDCHHEHHLIQAHTPLITSKPKVRSSPATWNQEKNGNITKLCTNALQPAWSSHKLSLPAQPVVFFCKVTIMLHQAHVTVSGCAAVLFLFIFENLTYKQVFKCPTGFSHLQTTWPIWLPFTDDIHSNLLALPQGSTGLPLASILRRSLGLPATTFRRSLGSCNGSSLIQNGSCAEVFCFAYYKVLCSFYNSVLVSLLSDNDTFSCTLYRLVIVATGLFKDLFS